jgi:microcystin-dependent protein
MTGQLHLVGDPVSDIDAASKGYVDAILPIGIILPFGGITAPAGHWALCNGASLAIASYPKLYAVLGTRFGTGTGTFMIPNMAGRIVVAVDSARTDMNVVGKYGGTWAAPVAAHTHTMSHDHGAFNSSTNQSDHTHAINPPSTTTAAGGAHDHSVSWVQDQNTGEAGSGARFVGYVGSGLHADTGPASPATHTHTVDIAQFNSGVNSGDHTHSVNVPPFVGNTTSSGTAGVEHLPPFICLTYIIRID